MESEFYGVYIENSATGNTKAIRAYETYSQAVRVADANNRNNLAPNTTWKVESATRCDRSCRH